MTYYGFDIDDNNAVSIWLGREKADDPTIYQDRYPNGDAWTKAEAEQWASIVVESATVPDYQFQPGNSKDQPFINKIVDNNEADSNMIPESILNMLAELGLSESDLVIDHSIEPGSVAGEEFSVE